MVDIFSILSKIFFKNN